jgi:beta-carotene 3-hydroxylase
MSLIAQISVFFITFFVMEFMAWFSHKYVMHGFLWSLHKDHHHKDHNSWFERNDLFFIFYAVVSMGCVILWGEYGLLQD